MYEKGKKGSVTHTVKYSVNNSRYDMIKLSEILVFTQANQVCVVKSTFTMLFILDFTPLNPQIKLDINLCIGSQYYSDLYVGIAL